MARRVGGSAARVGGLFAKDRLLKRETRLRDLSFPGPRHDAGDDAGVEGRCVWDEILMEMRGAQPALDRFVRGVDALVAAVFLHGPPPQSWKK